MGSKKPGAKASKPAVAERVAEILRIRLDGAAFHDCVTYAAEKQWGVSERQVGRYIAAADELLAERQERKRRRVIGLALARREALYARAVNGADYRTALAVADSLAKLQGLFTDARDLKELARLAASQGDRIRELEKRLEDAHGHPGATPPERAAAGPVGAGADPDG